MFDYLSPQTLARITTTVILVVVALGLRAVLSAAITRDAETLNENQRRWLAAVQNGSVAVVLLGGLFIWAPQLSTFALSLTAFVVAIVIATKEFLLCIVGSLYRALSRPFEIGDWIEIDGLRGEVLNDGLLATRLQELGEGVHQYDYTGRVLTLPNSLFLTKPVQNKSFRKNFVYHTFEITVTPDHDIPVLLERMLEKSGALTSEFAETAHRYWSMVRRKTRIEIPAPEPSIRIDTNHIANVVLAVTIFCPTGMATRLEHEMKAHALTVIREQRRALSPQ